MHQVLMALQKHPLPFLDFGRRETMIGNLLLMHGMILATEHLLEEAIKLSSGRLRSYYVEHLEEERNHSAWILDDLKSAKVTPPSVDWEAAQIAGIQYYLIYHVSPQALLGYIAALECRPASMDFIERLEGRYGAALLRTARYHAEHDVDHGAAVLNFIDSLPDANLELISENAARTALALQAALNEKVKRLEDARSKYS